MRRPLQGTFFILAVLGLMAALIGLVLFVENRLDEPEVVVEVVERLVEVTPTPTAPRCFYAAMPDDSPLVIIPFGPVGPAPPNWNEVYLCDREMNFSSRLPDMGEVLNVEAHVSATQGAANGN